MFTINIAEGAVKVYQNTPEVLEELRKVNQRLDDLVVNDPARIAEAAARVQAEAKRIREAIAQNPAPEQS